MSEVPGQEPTTETTNTATMAEDAQAESLLAEAVTSEADDSDGAGEDQESKTFDADYVKRLRDEAAQHRVKSKELEGKLTAAEQRQQEQMDQIAKALGLKDDDSPPDPEKLTQQLTEAQKQAEARENELRALRVERAAERAARAHSADVDALLDSRSFADKLGQLDPSAEDFSEQLDALVGSTVKANPKFKAASQAPAASSGDFSGGSGDKAGPLTVDDLRKLRNERREV